MKRRLQLLAIGSMAIFALTAGIAAVSYAQGANGSSPIDFVVGGGHHSDPDTQFTLSVHSGPLGQNAKGQMTLKIGDQARILVDVTCLIIDGNQAVATGLITRPASFAGQPVVMHAVDNGEPDRSLTPDLLRFSFDGFISSTPNFVTPPAGQDITGCLFPVLAPVPVTEGNIVVTDAQS
ncbi:MAG TPA: hypothetical protein VEW48_12215 [Thermoanaerobaculia bacterium]|nr:hypothetical protein [Thermoanaerobaculia bacterium]